MLNLKLLQKLQKKNNKQKTLWFHNVFLLHKISLKVVSGISVLKVNLEQIKNNIKILKHNNQKFCAVVKSDAYGCGMIKTCKTIEDQVDMFAVASRSEFFKIKNVVQKPILILMPIYENITILAKSGAVFSVCNKESFQAIFKCAKKYKDLKFYFNVAINTGMNRFGFSCIADVVEIFKIVQKTQNLFICGVFSHYFAGNVDKFAHFQNLRFLKFKKEIQKLKLKNELIFHISNSDGLDAGTGFDMVRVGMKMYGERENSAIELESKVLQILFLKKGEISGYSACFVAKSDNTKIAVVGIGYGDGIFRNIQNKGYVLINNSFAKIVAVCMDCLIVDVSNISAKVGDVVTIIGRNGDKQIFVCDVASWCDTISYEIMAKLSGRIKRKYIRG